VTDARVFLLWPDGRIEELDDEDDTYYYDPDPDLYEELVKAGYPPSYHGDFSIFDAIIDLRVAGERVTVFTPGPTPREHDMGPAAGLFLAWMRQHAPNNDQ
jgi:hypothetical protein